MRSGWAPQSSRSAPAFSQPISPSIPCPARARASNSPSVKAVPETTATIRIAIADDHQIFRDGLRKLLESEEGFEVVAEAGDGSEAIAVTTSARPDVLLLDVAMPTLGGIEALPALVASA